MECKNSASLISHSDLAPSSEIPVGQEASNRDPPETLVVELPYQPPLAWAALLTYLAGRATAGVEAVDGNRYLRTVQLGQERGWFVSELAGQGSAIRLTVAGALSPVLQPLLERVRNIFDLDVQPQRIEKHFLADGVLKDHVARNGGLRVPGALHPFELGLRAILGQQISVRAATTLAGRFAAAFGCAIRTPFAGLTHLTPTPERVAAASLSELAALGVPRSRALSIQALAAAVAREELQLTAGVEIEAALAGLRRLPGIGEWTAQYVALRALRWPDAFPHTDLGIRRALGNLPPGQVLQLAEGWRPWRGYAAMYLWRSLETQP